MGNTLVKQIFSANGSWTAPVGVRYVIVTGCGGGGGGGGGAATSEGPTVTWGNYFTTGGGGGQPAPTFTQVVVTVPGTTYTVSIGVGGAGAIGGITYNVVGGTNPLGGVSPGYMGFSGQATIFGSLTFPGGQGGRRGELFTIASGGTNTNTNPALPVSLPAGYTTQAASFINGGASIGADDLVRIGALSENIALATFNADYPLFNYIASGNVAGGGGSGGVSNNIYSIGGYGGNGAGFNGNAFAGGGGSGFAGGGGGGGGGGEGHNYNNTHDGGGGGNGGNGFVEVSWVA